MKDSNMHMRTFPELDIVFKLFTGGLLLVDNEANVMMYNDILKSLLPTLDLTQNRFGDVFGCSNGGKSKCGTAEQCNYCNIRNTIYEVSKNGEKVEGVVFDHDFKIYNEVKTLRLEADFVPYILQDELFILIFIKPVLYERILKLAKIDELSNDHPFIKMVYDSNRTTFLEKSIANFSHEMCHPLGDMKLGNSYIESQVKKLEEEFNDNQLTKEQFLSSIKEIKEVCQQLDNNVGNSIVYVQAIREVALNDFEEAVHSIKLKEYLNALIISMRCILKKHNVDISINVEKTVMVKCKSSTVSSIFRNLVQNSIVHGFKEIESPKIEIDIQETQESFVIVYKDNGVGVPFELRDKVFEIKYSTGNQKSSGLGMTLIKHLVVKELGGSIQLNDSKVGVEILINVPKS